MPSTLLAVPVLLAGVYLVALAFLALISPDRARRFLSSFASSATAHFAELLLRLTVGAALVAYASRMLYPTVFRVFGWVMVITTAALLLVPWRWHRRFATWSVPHATRHLPILAIGSLAGGLFLLLSVVYGSGVDAGGRP